MAKPAWQTKQPAWLKKPTVSTVLVPMTCWRAMPEPVPAISTEMMQPHSEEEAESAWMAGLDSSTLKNNVVVAPAKMSEEELSTAFLAKIADMTGMTAPWDAGDGDNFLSEDEAKTVWMAKLDRVMVAIEQERVA